MATAGEKGKKVSSDRPEGGGDGDSFKYLGTIIDKKLTFKEHADIMYKKSHQRLFLLKKLKSFEGSPHVIGLDMLLLNKRQNWVVLLTQLVNSLVINSDSCLL